MMSLPIVERELRMAARHPLTYRVRFYAALIMIGLAFFILAVGPSGRSLSSLAQTFFAILTVVAFGYALLAGAFFTADCLSVEKRDGTLGLLFLTDLTGADVVLGKLAATSLHAFYGLLAVFPVLALPLLMGGITGGEFWRVLLVLVNTLLISLAVGLLVSVLTRGERQAVGTTLTAVGAIAGGLPALYKLLESRLSLGGFEPWLLYPSPGVGLRFAFDAAYRSGGAHYFWGSMLTLLLLSLGCVALATLILSRSSHEVTGSVASGGWRGGWQRWRWGGPTRHGTVRQRELERRPFLWLVDRDRLPKISSGVFGLAALGFGLWAWFEITSTNSRDFVVAMYATFVIHLMLKIRVAGEACWHLNAARRGRVLETLLVTPLTVKEILRDQVIALRRRFLWPGIALCLLNLIFLAIIIRHARPAFDPHEIGIFTRLSLGGILMLACDFYALSWVGMWLGISTRTFSRAVGGTIGRVMGLPWLVFGLFVFSSSHVAMKPESFENFLSFWFVLGAIVDGVFAAKAKRRLLKELRVVAAEEHASPRADLGWWPFSVDLDGSGASAAAAGDSPAQGRGETPQ